MDMKIYHYHDVHFRGTIERVCYQTTNPEGELRNKYANVYLPYGYDPSDISRKYNILYVMHGGGGNPDAWLDCSMVKNMLDYSIDAGEIESLIVVFPSFYKEAIPRVGRPVAAIEHQKTVQFMPELTGDLLPAVESMYNVYAENTTDEGLRTARTHRAFGGFSMGSNTTWLTLMHKLDYFSYFVPMSGDSWVICGQGGATHTVETVDYICDKVRASGYGLGDYKIFAATGTKDLAYAGMLPMIEEMKTRTDVFAFEDAFSRGNLHFAVAPELVHCYEHVVNYLYTYLPYLFK